MGQMVEVDLALLASGYDGFFLFPASGFMLVIVPLPY